MDLSGFNAVAFVRDSAINSVLSAISVDFGSMLRQSAAFSLAIPDPSGSGATIQVAASGTVYLASAVAACVDNPDNVVACSIRGYARVSLTVDGRNIAAIPLRLDGEIDVPVRLTGAEHIFPDPVLDLSGLSVTRAAVTVLDSGIDPYTLSLVVSGAFAEALTDQLRNIGSSALKISIPDMTLLTIYAEIAQNNILVPFLYPLAVRVMDGCFAVGFGPAEGPIPPSSGLTLPWPDYDIGVAALQAAEPGFPPMASSQDVDVLVAIDTASLNPALVVNAKLLLVQNATSGSFQIDSVAITPFQTRFAVDLRIQQNVPDPLSGQIHAHVSLDLRLVRKGFGLGAVVRNLGVDVDVPWFASALASVGAFFGFSQSPEDQIRDKILGPTFIPSFDPTWQGILPGFPMLDPGVPIPDEYAKRGLQFGVALGGVIVDPVASMVAGTVSAFAPVADFAIATPNFGRFHIRDRFVSFSIGHPELDRDPSLWLEWDIIDSQGNVQWSTAGWADQVARAVSLDITAVPGVYPLPQFTVRCRARRGQTVEVPFEDSRVLTIVDPLDRSHPYFHHSRGIGWKTGKGEPDGHKIRRSAIHKTAFPGRCEFADKFTSAAHVFEYLDTLPEPIGTYVDPDQDVGNFSRRLCQYCFYGSPQKGPRPMSRRLRRFLLESVSQSKDRSG